MCLDPDWPVGKEDPGPQVCFRCSEQYPEQVNWYYGEPGVDKGWFPDSDHLSYHTIQKHRDWAIENFGGEEAVLRLKAIYEKRLGM